MIILDASALYPLAKRALQEPEKIARVLVRSGIALLDLTLYEASNAAVVEARRGLVKDPSKIATAVAELAQHFTLIRIDPDHVTQITELAKKLKLTAYDAAYIYYARLYNAKLVTNDSEILEKAKDVAYSVSEWLETVEKQEKP